VLEGEKYEDEVSKGLFTYEDGKLQGPYKAFYESGKVLYEWNYVDGKLEGKAVGYYESGKVENEANWVDGKLEGKAVWYYESGNSRRSIGCAGQAHTGGKRTPLVPEYEKRRPPKQGQPA